MLPGKSYTPEDVLRILRKRLWVLLLPLAVITAVAALTVRRMPNYYRAETVILVVPQTVPETFVRPTVTSRIGDRLRAINPSIQSRTRLERIIRELDLYPDERRRMPMEDVVGLMRSAIDVQTLRDDAFYVRYIGREPRKVMEVTNRLASLYIDESVSARQDLAESTDEFLETQLAETKMRLQEQENRLAAYRREHASELPSQVNSNQMIVSNAQAQVLSLADAIVRLQDRRVELERQLADADSGKPETAAPGTSAASPLAQQLEAAQVRLANVRANYLPTHPEVQAAERAVSDIKAKVDAEAAATASLRSDQVSAATARERRVLDLRANIAEVDKQIVKAKQDQARFQAAGEEAQRRIDSLPIRDNELLELTRDSATLTQLYNDLLRKKSDAMIAANLERQQIGEQFRLLDEARLPERPFSPNRTQLTSMAAGIGLVIGLALAGLLEYRDRTFETDRDISTVLSLPVLASIPLMRSEAEERKQFLRRLGIDVGCGGLVAGCAALVFYTLVR